MSRRYVFSVLSSAAWIIFSSTKKRRVIIRTLMVSEASVDTFLNRLSVLLPSKRFF